MKKGIGKKGFILLVILVIMVLQVATLSVYAAPDGITRAPSRPDWDRHNHWNHPRWEYASSTTSVTTGVFRLPKSVTLTVGETVTWNPFPEGGRWYWDYQYLKANIEDETGKFTALKSGTTQVWYTTKEDVRHTIEVTIVEAPSLPAVVSSQNSTPPPSSSRITNTNTGASVVIFPVVIALSGAAMLGTSLVLKDKKKKH